MECLVSGEVAIISQIDEPYFWSEDFITYTTHPVVHSRSLDINQSITPSMNSVSQSLILLFNSVKNFILLQVIYNTFQNV